MALPGMEILDPTNDSGKAFYSNLKRIIEINPPASTTIDSFAMKNGILGAIELAVFIMKYTKDFNPQQSVIGLYLGAILQEQLFLNYETGYVKVYTALMPYSTFIRNITIPYQNKMKASRDLAVYLGKIDAADATTNEEYTIFQPSSKFIEDVRTGNLFV